MEEKSQKHWVCKVCGYVYDGKIPFEDLPDEWVCPFCGVGKDEFVLEQLLIKSLNVFPIIAIILQMDNFAIIKLLFGNIHTLQSFNNRKIMT